MELLRGTTICLSLFLILICPVLHGDTCVQSTFDLIQGTTCSIGTLQFSFGVYPFYSLETNDVATGAQLGSALLPVSDLSFTPVLNGSVVGFQLSGLPAVLSSASTSTGSSFDFYYNVTASTNAPIVDSSVALVDIAETHAGEGQRASVIGKSTISSATYPYTFLGLAYTWHEGRTLDGQEAGFDQANAPILGASDLSVESEWQMRSIQGGTISAKAVQYNFTTAIPVPEPPASVLLLTGILVLAPFTIRSRH
jgi:hypothetical protein